MSQWGNNDIASNSVIWAPAQLAQAPTRTNANLLFGNTTANGYGTGQTIGLYGVDTTETNVAGGPLVSGFVTFSGSGYTANATVTVTVINGGTSGVVNAQANSTGRISAINISTRGSGYIVPPVLAVAAPSAQTFNANSTGAITLGNSSANGFITLGANRLFFQNNDIVTYLVGASNTALGGLANASTYYVITANTTAIQLTTTANGPAINISSAGTGAQAGHSITGQTATGTVTVGGGKHAVHSGWVLRTEGTGGRAGRVQYETLVAMGTISTNPDAEDIAFPDS